MAAGREKKVKVGKGHVRRSLKGQVQHSPRTSCCVRSAQPPLSTRVNTTHSILVLTSISCPLRLVGILPFWKSVGVKSVREGDV